MSTHSFELFVFEMHAVQASLSASFRCLCDQGGERELVLGADDHLMKESSRSIPREDVAELCVQCLGVSEAQNR